MGCNFMKQFLHHSKTCSTGTVPVKISLLNAACNRITQSQLLLKLSCYTNTVIKKSSSRFNIRPCKLIKCCIRCYRKIIYTVAIRITDGREIVMLKLVNLKRKVWHVHFLTGLQEISVPARNAAQG